MNNKTKIGSRVRSRSSGNEGTIHWMHDEFTMNVEVLWDVDKGLPLDEVLYCYNTRDKNCDLEMI